MQFLSLTLKKNSISFKKSLLKHYILKYELFKLSLSENIIKM